ncbi:TonB-dependent receptor [Advenella mimigardefordensis]|uniref:Putative rhizobactin receptor n=1 Tax=Advenella mimigardefordensis (strain DSM 17166 / LMG 22922 / DPN7) TaxID=1247726 RepID=W0P8X2_ADVMD|nr:TonB-dependent receptor [Advenella mimigardefordensis]AHG63289.1 putative rhizobactin receptor [Advenella mimigardefordensis DPN7]
MAKNKHRLLSLPTTLALLFGIFPGSLLWAQDAESEALPTEKLEPIVAVASATPRSIEEIAATVWFIDSKRIAQSSAMGKTLGQILGDEIPGLDASSGGRTNNGQNLRGRGILVMIDGVSLNSSRQISRQLDSIYPNNIERVEVLSGASAVYGGGATGGIINIVTKKSDSGIQGSFSVNGVSGFKGGQDGDYSMSAEVSGGNERMSARGAISLGRNRATYNADGELIVPDITQGSLQYNRTADIMGSTRFNFDNDKALDLSVQYYESKQRNRYGLNFGKNFKSFPNFEISDGYEADRQGATRRWAINAQYSDQDFLGHRWYSQLSWRREVLDFIPFIYTRPAPYFAASQQTTSVLSARTALEKQWNNLKFTYGFDGYIDRLDSNQIIFDRKMSAASGGLINERYKEIGRYPGTRVSSAAGFLQLDYAISPQWQVSGGYRYQYLKNRIDDFIGAAQQTRLALGLGRSADHIAGGTNSYRVGLWNLGTVYKFSPQTRLWANFSQGFELPDPAKFYGQGKYVFSQGHYKLVNGSNVSGSRLKGIKTDSFEVGGRYADSSAEAQISAFYSISDGSIDYDRKTLLITQSDNKKRIFGVDGKVSYWLTKQLQLGGLGHYVNTRIKSGDRWAKASITDASPSKASVWALWRTGTFDAKIQANRIFSMEDGSGHRLNGYTTVDASYLQQLGRGEITIGIQNLFNKKYTTVWGQRAKVFYAVGGIPESMFDYQGRGRTFSLGYTYAF